ncbi:TIGR02611 family protein [Microbacterium sp. G2-8]|uniref:TIGR02611 family protein n=1 Tax=Microbacterium sp. G2-8 TaxID=2842454 RepID=UPI0021AA30CF|nr:TIGR02611 family protein [Microbacterium sp. G2-8]
MSHDSIHVVSMPRPADASSREKPGLARRGGRAARRAIGRNRYVEGAYKTIIGVVGGAITVIGLVLVPLPGPGWLIVFAGLVVLATEFPWARRAAAWLKRQLDRFVAWWRARRERRASASR